MMWMLLSLSALCVASALAAESPRRVAFLTAPQTAAQARDGGGFGGGHGGGHGGGKGGHGGGHGGGSHGSYSSYQKPYDTGSKGNMYYYYYPVEEQHRYPSHQSGGFGGGGILALLAAIFLPILVLGGALLLLAAIAAALNPNRRSLQSGDWDVSQWSAELERLLYTHIDLLEAEDCAPRLVCELGVRTQPYRFPGKEALVSTVEQWVPAVMRHTATVLKKASLGAYDSAQCRKLFKCDPFLVDNLLQGA